METKHILFIPKSEPPTYEGVVLGSIIVRRYREILESKEAQFNDTGIKVMKRELAKTIRHETGNEMCMADTAMFIDDAVSEYVDEFAEKLKYNDDKYCTYLLTRLVRKIEDEVMHPKRIVKT